MLYRLSYAGSADDFLTEDRFVISFVPSVKTAQTYLGGFMNQQVNFSGDIFFTDCTVVGIYIYCNFKTSHIHVP